MFVLPILLSIPAIVFARRARRIARDLPGRPGWAAATWGLWLGWFTLLWPTLLVAVFVVGATGGTMS
ncbi:hypothetical protein [Patulibacter sp.]|uniref:hypothetical protein n=1 Tax=Patulibacter sp. TaxID=1912859 RepID=UPI00271B1802|nr:hypothetical protein [Patulibacter sp.]MDO9408065.1 hypothetical protein [Patulibacter sp.]